MGGTLPPSLSSHRHHRFPFEKRSARFRNHAGAMNAPLASTEFGNEHQGEDLRRRPSYRRASPQAQAPERREGGHAEQRHRATRDESSNQRSERRPSSPQ